MLKVATHSGTFHADDVFAFAILRASQPDGIDLVRTRELALMEQADVVFDVGGIYDRAARRYDHHMRDKPLRPNGEPFSSAGLVWRDYGLAAVGRLQPGLEPKTAERIVAMIDQGLIRDVDLMDNGAMTPVPGHFSTLVEAFNITFVEKGGDENAAFLAAADLASAVLARVVAQANASAQAEASVAEAAARADDPRIIVLDVRVPWEDAIFDLGLDQALYVVRPAGDAWTCSAVPPERGSFGQRLSLPDAWGGIRDEDFAKMTGVSDATFCHPARFVCGAKSREGVLALAKMAVIA